MKIFALGFFLWVIALIVLARVVGGGIRCPGLSRHRAVFAVLLLLGGIVLLFRPHEDLFGGQDQGAYVNAAATYARRQALSYRDPLLSQVPESVRPDFFYGDDLFPDTKDMCLWVEDVPRARIGTWFQPAYPILMSVAATLGPDRWVLYVSPLFTLFTALALWALARRLFGHPWAGVAAAGLYVLNPITVWHGRGARAEGPASFFFFAAAVLLLRFWQQQDRRGAVDLLCASLCLALAPFFHVSAWIAVLPLAGLLGIVSLWGYPGLLAVPAAVFLGLAGFLVQARTVTDSYELTRLLKFVFEHPVVWLGAGAAALGAAAVLSARMRGKRDVVAARSRAAVPAIALGFASLSVLVLLLAYLNVLAGTIQESGERALRLVGVTEARAVVHGLSPALALAGLAGWCVLIVRGGEGQRIRLLFALALFPAVLLVGRIPILMYFLRRALPFLVPVLALSLAALVSLVPPGVKKRRAVAAIGIVAALALFGIRGRGPLFTVTDLRGFGAFLEPFAREIQREKGILLCEYSRLAAPFDHFFGIPTLGLDNERRFEYQAALDAWAGILRGDARRPAFFLTPFAPPLSERFDFEEVASDEFRMRMLRSTPGRLPDIVREPVLRLALYRMRLRERAVSPGVPAVPYVRRLDESNMGLRGFHRGRTRAWDVEGEQVEMYSRWARAEADVLLPAPPDGRGFLLMLLNPCHPDEHRNLRLLVSAVGDDGPAFSHKLEHDGWQWVVCPFPAGGRDLQWVRLTTRPALNPGRYGYPTDLGVLLKVVVVVPSIESVL